MHRWWGALLVALVLSAACNGGSGPGPTPTAESSAPTSATSATVSTEPSYPNARPGEKPPARPVDILSDEGAEAFAVYFVKTLDWAYATMDTALLQDASAPECHLCGAFIAEFATRNTAGDVLHGSRSTILTVDFVAGANSANQLVNVVFSATALEVRDARGVVIDASPAIPRFQMNVRIRFDAPRWSVIEAKKVVAQ